MHALKVLSDRGGAWNVLETVISLFRRHRPEPLHWSHSRSQSSVII